MKPEHKPQYSIVRTEEFIAQTQELKKRYQRMPDLIRAIDWALERKPHWFSPASGKYYLWKTEELSNHAFPEVKVLYKIDEENMKVILMSIDD
jgi:hypothetical protein